MEKEAVAAPQKELKPMSAPTKFTDEQIKHWQWYERVRAGGRYNMICDSRAREATGLDREEYLFCIENYSELMAASAPRQNK